MIVVQLVLIATILYVLARFLSYRNTSETRAWKKIMLILFTVGIVVTVINPELANRTANLVGVGRGADLLLYMLTMAFIFQELSTYIKSKDEQKSLVKLARKVAIIEAQNRNAEE